MSKVADLFIDNFQGLPIWVKQVLVREVMESLKSKLNDFSELAETDNLFQYVRPKVTLKGKQELIEKKLNLSPGYYVFLQDAMDECNIFEITLKNNWTLADSAKIFIRADELELVTNSNQDAVKIHAIASFIAGKLKLGEFLKRIGKISVLQLEQAIRYQKNLNEEGRHLKMASILIKMGFISDKGLDSLLLLKEEARKRLPASIGLGSLKYTEEDDTENQIVSLQREIARLENENIIMKKRLKKLLNL